MKETQQGQDTILTSLGLPLEKGEENTWRIDLTWLKLFTGLSVIARMLGDEILSLIRTDNSDVALQRKIIHEITPELASLGLVGISIYARNDVLKNLPLYQEEFHDQIRAVFGTLQRPRWGGLLFPEFFGEEVLSRFEIDRNLPPEGEAAASNPPALLFPFHLHFPKEEIDYFFLVEREIAGRFLRITIERAGESRLNLKGIPHRLVDDLHRRTYLQGLGKFVDSVVLGVRRESENLRYLHTENERHQPRFFQQIRSAGLSDCDQVTVRWPAELSEVILGENETTIINLLKKSFLLLEDSQIVNRLGRGEVIEMRSGSHLAYLDLSRRGQSLNLSLEERRSTAEMDYYLKRMPALRDLSLEKREAFAGIRVFLIHHITSEILATIKAFENMGTPFLNVLFVKYAGIVPPDYLEALHTLGEDRFSFHGLQKIEPARSVEGYYLLSRQYSSVGELHALQALLDRRKEAYFEAMQLAAGHLFFREAVRAARDGQSLLLVEDGGYLAPLLNRFALEGKSLGEVLDHFGHGKEGRDERNRTGSLPFPVDEEERSVPLSDWLTPLLKGSVEHTRNGYDRLLSVTEDHGRLRFPAVSIAVSHLKREMESREVSVSILHAIESILHGLGLVLSGRRALILGHRGAIGTYLIRDLLARLGAHRLAGVDILLSDPEIKSENPEPLSATAPSQEGDAEEDSESPFRSITECALPEELPEEELHDTDLIIGVVGRSILDEEFLERFIADHKRSKIFFASGSTKTAEFVHLSNWLSALQRESSPTLRGEPVELKSAPIRDPQSGLIQGTEVEIRFLNSDKIRSLYLLGGLTPINFLYYGVPTETMDPVLTQLLRLSAGFIQNRSRLPEELLAVDHQIDEDGIWTGSEAIKGT